MANEPTKEHQIKFLSTTHVKPKKQLGRKEYELTIYDLFHITIPYNKKLFVYKGVSPQFEHIVTKLKNSLEIVLDEFYPLAGRLWKDEDGYYKVVYDDDMQGVEVVTATARGIETADLMDGKLLKELSPCNGFIGLDGLHQPLLAVQVTELKDGLVMVCSFNHAIVDGISLWHFMSSWSEICSGSKTISIQPFLDRTNVQNRRLKSNLILGSEKTAVSTGVADVDPTQKQIIETRHFNFSESVVDRIRFEVNANQLKAFSTLQCFAGHVWRSVTRARQLDSEVDVVLALAADCRKRLDPPMPKNYFGNIVQGIYTLTKAGKLLENLPVFGVKMIQKAIDMHDSKAIDNYNKEWESNPRVFQGGTNLVNCIVFGGSPRFKVYEVDFGWGKPEDVRSVGENKFDGQVNLTQGKSGGKSIDMEISLESKVMKNLENDKEFLMEADHVIETTDKTMRYVRFQERGKDILHIHEKDKEFQMVCKTLRRKDWSFNWKIMFCKTLRMLKNFK